MARGALLKGDCNIVHIARANGGVGDCDDGWELFNMVVDPGETHDLAPQYPDKLAELLELSDGFPPVMPANARSR